MLRVASGPRRLPSPGRLLGVGLVLWGHQHAGCLWRVRVLRAEFDVGLVHPPLALAQCILLWGHLVGDTK